MFAMRYHKDQKLTERLGRSIKKSVRHAKLQNSHYITSRVEVYSAADIAMIAMRK